MSVALTSLERSIMTAYVVIPPLITFAMGVLVGAFFFRGEKDDS